MKQRFRRQTIGSFVTLLLCGCASEWQADQPAKPVTYRVPAYRAERKVGNLRRLAIVPVRVHRVGMFSIVTHSERTEAHAVYDAASYLSEKKGYDVVPVVDKDGVWRPEVLFTTEYGSVDDLKEAWERASTKEEIAAAAKKIGRALNVDGVVSVWWEDYDAEAGGLLLPLFWGVVNIFPLFNAPLYYALLHTHAEAVIYETFSGRVIWRNKFSGDFESEPSIAGFFENLENAIPAQLSN